MSSVSVNSLERECGASYDYLVSVREAYMYLDAYSMRDARRVVRGIVDGGDVLKLEQEEPRLYSLFRFGGI